eukprot:symbB.v1.2.036603.t1/scaffold5121.1/size30665/1
MKAVLSYGVALRKRQLLACMHSHGLPMADKSKEKSLLPKVESKRLVDDQGEMKRLEEKSRELEREEEENRLERKRLQKELKELRKKRRAEGAAASVAEEERAKKR